MYGFLTGIKHYIRNCTIKRICIVNSHVDKKQNICKIYNTSDYSFIIWYKCADSPRIKQKNKRNKVMGKSVDNVHLHN